MRQVREYFASCSSQLEKAMTGLPFYSIWRESNGSPATLAHTHYALTFPLRRSRRLDAPLRLEAVQGGGDCDLGGFLAS
jgi:hypothetical protein